MIAAAVFGLIGGLLIGAVLLWVALLEKAYQDSDR